MNNIVNVAIQALPVSKTNHPYNIVDKAIEIIHNSGLTYKVCPFETVVEGKLDVILQLIAKIQEVCYSEGAETMMMYIKIQSSAINDVLIEDKMKKYS
ncbi:MAG: thiamine-binding protein [Bacteroidia bacterium]|nr:thiamine-binding protein [Bacteroidia bacterium]